MKRIIIAVLDSFGIGGAEDAEKFGDSGADTYGHIAQQCAQGLADVGRSGPLMLPNLTRLGLAQAHSYSTGVIASEINSAKAYIGLYGYASELSSGKDTVSGHWEIAGVPVLFNWGYFTNIHNSFPAQLLNNIVAKAGIVGYLGNCHASGTAILDELGEDHIQSGKPIFYTSADSVFQIACHEETFGLEKLYRLCEIARQELDDGQYNIGRVIARPFVGKQKGQFTRTGNRHDYAVEPVSPTVLQKFITEKQGLVISIGKIADIYAHTGITTAIKATGIGDLFDNTLQQMQQTQQDAIIFTNFVDFDSTYGHRRDVAGYASALEYFDRRLPEIIGQLQPDDLLILTADHGCDPTWHGTDHTREHIPILLYGNTLPAGFIGHRKTFADIGQTIAKYFSISEMNYGQSIL
ncbi:phosphopentomutase [Citrobacter portucalensis]|uniref:phosphopentomutase n=1 Tax=Citrobacter portucalensis TaxID=1639133 RepID=UPI002592E356|nr:phosphopentomutase [uncultured Citrobacter sp.]